MKYPITLIFILSLLGVHAQTVNTEKWTLKKTSVEYAIHRPDSGIKEILFAFHDGSDPAWKKESWAQELTWLVEERHSIVVAPDSQFNTLDSSGVAAFIQSIWKEEDKAGLRFITIGDGFSGLSALMSFDASGLVIASSDTLSFSRIRRDVVVGLIDSRKGDSTMRVSKDLHEAGAWVFQKMVIGEHPYYFDGHRSAISYMMNQIDSMSLLLSDSAFMASLKTKVLEAGPDVLRQGRPFETSLMVAKQGEFQVNVLNLSAEVVWRTLTFLGKGKHVIEIPTKDLPWGVYKIEIDGPSFLAKQKLMIRG